MSTPFSEVRLATHHEAAHVIAAWALDLPLQYVRVDDKGNGTTRLSHLYSWTAMFREVNRETVRRNTLFVLAGDCGEQLVSFSLAQDDVTSDDYYAWFLARKFCLNLRQLRSQAEQLILSEQKTVIEIASELYRRRIIGSFDLALWRMNWLAQGSSAQHVIREVA